MLIFFVFFQLGLVGHLDWVRLVWVFVRTALILHLATKGEGHNKSVGSGGRGVNN